MGVVQIMTYKEEFIKFMADSGVLTFGDFTLKSGRKAPYFINAGNYKTGAQLAKLGEFYAHCINENNIEADVFFRPCIQGHTAFGIGSCSALQRVRQGRSLLFRPQRGQRPRRGRNVCRQKA